MCVGVTRLAGNLYRVWCLMHCARYSITMPALGHKPGQNVSAHLCCKNPSVIHNDDVSMSLIRIWTTSHHDNSPPYRFWSWWVLLFCGSGPRGELSWWGILLGIVVPVGNGWASFLSDGELSLVGSCPRTLWSYLDSVTVTIRCKKSTSSNICNWMWHFEWINKNSCITKKKYPFSTQQWAIQI